ncbi:ribonuclease H-like domain-containing protein, partial [Tanacetum coccineum]
SYEPSTYYEAVKNPNWIEAINNKIKALNRNNTWTICHLPEGRKAIRSKWFFKIKYNSTGAIGRYKASQKGKVCKLNKSLYGLKQAPKQWNAKLTMALLENGFVQSKFDYSLFTKKSDKVFIALLDYVNDIMITMLDNKEGICLSQRKYYLKLLHEYGLLAAKHVDTPLPENTTLHHIETDDDHLLNNIGNYQKLVGKIIFCTNIRPDISYVVYCLSQYMHAPIVSYLDAALRVLRYLKGSLGSGIQINKSDNLKLRAYVDSDWARCPTTKKSVSGHLQRQNIDSWLLLLVSSALQIVANPVFHEKSKHFEIDVHLVREKVDSGVIKTEKIHTSQQIADVLSKALDIEQHKSFCVKLGMLDMFKVEKLEEGC